MLPHIFVGGSVPALSTTLGASAVPALTGRKGQPDPIRAACVGVSGIHFQAQAGGAFRQAYCQQYVVRIFERVSLVHLLAVVEQSQAIAAQVPQPHFSAYTAWRARRRLRWQFMVGVARFELTTSASRIMSTDFSGRYQCGSWQLFHGVLHPVLHCLRVKSNENPPVRSSVYLASLADKRSAVDS